MRKLISATLVLALAGALAMCSSSKSAEQQSGTQPVQPATQPAGEHPKGVHPKGDHPSGEHPSGDRPDAGSDRPSGEHPK